jgi:thioester reductase-like protein
MTLSSKNIALPSFERIHCLPSDLSRDDLGLSSAMIEKLRDSLTSIIHCAWAVNFNLGVKSFENQHIRGAFNLISLCLKTRTPTPAKFFFCSSISVAAGTPLPAVISESQITDLTHAQNMGYARSKLVTENIIAAAARQTGMMARVLRVGQIVGDTITGTWNTTEAIPLMIRSAVTLGVLPALEEVRLLVSSFSADTDTK